MNRNSILVTAAIMVAVFVGGAGCMHAQWRTSSIFGRADAGISGLHAIGNDTLLASTTNSGLFVSFDAGVSWQQTFRGLPRTSDAPGIGQDYIPIRAVTGRGNRWFCGTLGAGLYTRDTSTAWRRVPGLDSTTTVMSMAMKGDTLYVGMFLYGLWRLVPGDTVVRPFIHPSPREFISVEKIRDTPWGLLLSTNEMGYVLVEHDTTYVPMNEGVPEREYVQAVATEVSESGWMVGGTLLRDSLCCGVSVRNGLHDTWSSFRNGLDITFATPFAITSHRNVFYMATGYLNGIGIWTWQPGQASWTNWNEGMQQSTFDAMIAVPLPSGGVRIVAGARYGGIFYRDSISEPVSVHEGTYLVDAERIEMPCEVVDICGRRWYPASASALPPGVYMVTTGKRRAFVVGP